MGFQLIKFGPIRINSFFFFFYQFKASDLESEFYPQKPFMSVMQDSITISQESVFFI